MSDLDAEARAAALKKLAQFGAQFMASLGVEPVTETTQSTTPEAHEATSSEEEEEEEEMESEEEEEEEKEEETPKVQVIKFNDPSKKVIPTNKRDYKAFMSSKVERISGEKKSDTQKKTRSKREQEQDAIDRIHDQALQDLLNSTDLVERIVSEKLQGKDRHKYMERKLVELGAKPMKKKGVVPINFYLNGRKKREKKLQRQLEEARQTDMYRPNLKRELEQQLGIKRKKVKKDRGLRVNTGTFRDGTLHLRQKDIEQITKK